MIGMTEQKMSVTFSLLACMIILVTWNPPLAHGDPDPMARPTRPKVFTSAEELRRYLDLVRDYYSLSGKARYGKRAQVLPMGNENPWGVARIPPVQAGLFALRQQQLEQLQQIENPAKHQLQRELQNYQQDQLQQGGQQPLNDFYDVMAKYYDELQ